MLEEIKELSKPLIKFIKENYDPHTVIIIRDDYVQVLREDIGIPINVQ